MNAKRAEVERALKNPSAYRFFLLYGPDESGSHSLVKVAASGAGAEAERVELTGAELKADPAGAPTSRLKSCRRRRYIVVQRGANARGQWKPYAGAGGGNRCC